MKGGGVVEQLARVQSAAFDKTGTLTTGKPQVVDVQAESGETAEDVVRLAAAVESASLYLRSESGSTRSAAFSLLLAANVRSVEARYPGDSLMTETGPEYDNLKPLQIVKYWIQTNQTGKIVGILNSFESQSDNCPEWRESVAFQLCEQIRGFLLDEMLQSAGDDVNLSASFEAPEDPRETAMNAVLSKVNSRAIA